MQPLQDYRYTVTYEYVGQPAAPQYVIRFCGDYIDHRSTYPAAVTRAAVHSAIRGGGLIFTEIKP